jgi:HlyD family secretion protein
MTIRKHWMSVASRLALALTLVLPLAACGEDQEEPLAVPVTRASVTTTATATGTLQAITEQNLGFAAGGRLAELDVVVGQHVEPGQVLAKLDDFEAQQELSRAQALLDQERAVLGRIRDGNQLAAAEADVARAQDVLEATEEQADAVNDANDAAVEEAERQLAFDRENLDEAENRASADRAQCEDSVGGDTRRREDDGVRLPSTVRPEACEGADDSDERVAAAERRVRASEAAIEHAEQNAQVDSAEQNVAVENARRDVTTAQNEAQSAASDRPHDIDEQIAVVDQAQADVDLARRAVDDTVLRAPIAGTVASVNGVVGEFIDAGSGTTPLAPGGEVPLPGGNSAVSSQQSGGAESDRPGGSAFIVLDDVNSFQLVAPFAEVDTARLEPNQAVQMTFDAIPDLTRTGTLVAIAPTGTDIQGVTSYYASIVLNELDPRLKDGLTAIANVVVEQKDDVLVVPNAAILQGGGGTGVVTVLQPDGTQSQVQIELGLQGDSVTEVISGLDEGQQVVVAQPD